MKKIFNILIRICVALRLITILFFIGHVVNTIIVRPLKWVLAIIGRVTEIIFKNPLYSLIVFMLFYFALFSWQMAIALVISVLVHESGHISALKKLKLKHSKVVFVPMVGAMIGLEDEYITSRKKEATMAIMGPLFGTALALMMTGIWLIMPNAVIILTVFISSIMNLFNLVPIGDMDGGRVLRSIIMSVNEKIGLYFCIALSLVLLCGIGIYLQWYVSLVIFFLAVAPMLILYLADKPAGTEKLEKKQVIIFSAAYIVLAITLFVLLAYSIEIINNSNELTELIKFRFE